MAKKFLLNTLKEEENLEWSDPWLQSIDLEYHNISFDQGLHYALLRDGPILFRTLRLAAPMGVAAPALFGGPPTRVEALEIDKESLNYIIYLFIKD